MIWVALAIALGAPLDGPQYTDPAGVGVETCPTWMQNKMMRRARGLDEQWLFGFLSGADFALAKSDERKLLWPSDTPQDYVTYIDVYCAAHPKDTVDAAAKTLVRKFEKEGGL